MTRARRDDARWRRRARACDAEHVTSVARSVLTVADARVESGDDASAAMPGDWIGTSGAPPLSYRAIGRSPMRVLFPGTRSVALLAALFGLADCRPSSSVVPLPTPTQPAPRAEAPPTPRLAALVPRASVTLTASDGKGLTLARLSARAVLVGPLAFTELRFVFANPEPRVLEGTFAATLPQGASVSRFAMRIGEAWQEGEVLEKQQARFAFEEFLHRKRDPALLEQSAGSEFRARIFPIPAGGTKEILLSYAQEIRGAEPYVLPLRGLPEVGEVSLGAAAEGSNVVLATRSEARWTPDADFVVDRSGLVSSDGLRSGGLAVVRVRPAVDARPDPVTSAEARPAPDRPMPASAPPRARTCPAMTKRQRRPASRG